MNKTWISHKKGEFPTLDRLFLLIGYVFITLPLVEWPGSVIRAELMDWAKVLPFFFFTVALVNSEKRLKVFMLVFLLCQILRAVEPIYLYITTGYLGSFASFGSGADMRFLGRLSGAPHDTINPNQLAWVIITTIPFLYYLGWHSGFKIKVLVVGLSPVLIYALLLTGSRSGLLSLAVVVLAIIYVSGKKVGGTVIAGLLLVPLAFFVAGLLSSDLRERYASIFDEDAAGRAGVVARINGIKSQLSTVIGPRMVFGHGLGTSLEVSANRLGGRAQIAHDLYIEILQELGIVGLIIFLLYARDMLRSLRQAKQLLVSAGPEANWLRNLVLATMAWIIMDLFYSLSCFGFSSWEWYLFGGISTVCLKFAREHTAQGLLSEPGEYHKVPTWDQRDFAKTQA